MQKGKFGLKLHHMKLIGSKLTVMQMINEWLVENAQQLVPSPKKHLNSEDELKLNQQREETIRKML